MSKDKAKAKSQKQYSGIAAHKCQKKVLVPPMMAGPPVTLQSWFKDRLPEMLWCALLISQLGRSQALEIFRNSAALLQKLPAEQRTIQPTLSGLASPEVLQSFWNVRPLRMNVGALWGSARALKG